MRRTLSFDTMKARRKLVTDVKRMRKYFTDNYAARATVPLKGASIVDSSAQVLSDDTVLIAGQWQVERPGATSPLRYTFVMHKKGGHGGSYICINRRVRSRHNSAAAGVPARGDRVSRSDC